MKNTFTDLFVVIAPESNFICIRFIISLSPTAPVIPESTAGAKRIEIRGIGRVKSTAPLPNAFSPSVNVVEVGISVLFGTDVVAGKEVKILELAPAF